MKNHSHTNTPERLLLSMDEAADLLGIGRTYAYHLVSTGEWTTVKIGRLRRMRRSDLVAWLDKQTDENGGEA